MKIAYTHKKFNPEHAAIIRQANQIIAEYRGQGYDLTLRQLYYQFVGRDLFPESWQDPATNSTNNVRSYKKLGGIISDARRAGLIDWDAIVDRTRNLQRFQSWESPAHIVGACADQFDVDWWKDQDYAPEVWVEKDALIGVLETACTPFRVPYFSCRGYTSDSEIWGAAQRFKDDHRTPVVIHLGDHDPSGIDMSRDIEERLNLFGATNVEVRRIALNMDQIRQYDPPPNPAKETDSRFMQYRRAYGDESWELDALNPPVITALIGAALNEFIGRPEWRACERARNEGRETLRAVARRLEDEQDDAASHLE